MRKEVITLVTNTYLSPMDIKATETYLYDFLVDLSQTLIDEAQDAEEHEYNRRVALAIIDVCNLTTKLSQVRHLQEDVEPNPEAVLTPEAPSLPDADSGSVLDFGTQF